MKKGKKKKKQMNSTKIVAIVSSIAVGVSLVSIAGYSYYNFKTVSSLKSIEIKDNMKNDNKMTMEIELTPAKYVRNNDTWCAASKGDKIDNIKWVKAEKNKCVVDVEDTDYTIYLKNSYDNVIKVASKDVELNKIKNLSFNKKEYYIAVKGEEEFELNFEKYGLINTEVSYEISDTEALKIENNKFIGLKKGDVTVTAKIGNKSVDAIVHVMSSLVVPNVETNSKKDYIPCEAYTEEEEKLLDAALKDRVNTAGYGTRAGVVAAAIFLGLEFEYRIPYFFESGRLVNHSGARHVDGEGRYYHEGLYLTTANYAELEPGATYVGPKPWGCKLKNGTSKYGYVAGRMYPNGLDCSGFISWTLLNGGFDVGDVGAGDNTYRDDDLYDLGEKRTLTMDMLNGDEIKPGDLIAYWGHMAMVIDRDENNIYIAESLPMTKGVIIKKYTKAKAKQIFVNVMLMDEVYKSDGNLDAVKWHATK